MRKGGASVFIYLIFGILIAIFVVNIGPGKGKGDDGGCTGTSNQVVTVDGSEATETAYHIAYSTPYNRGQGAAEHSHWAIEALIRREMLAAEATDHGLRVGGGLVDEDIKRGFYYWGGQKISIKDQLFEEKNGKTIWSYERLKAWAASLNVSLNSYRGEQERSMQASLMAQILRDSVRVSREEARSSWEFDNNTVDYDVVTYSPTPFKDAMKLTDADLARFVAAHEAEVKKKFSDNERLYKDVKPELHLRQIFIDKKVADGKTKLEAVRKDVTKDKFIAAAKDLSSDAEEKANGGDLRWRKADGPQLGDKQLNDAVKSLKVGEVSPVIETDRGAFLVFVEDKREGNLTFDQVKNELAVDLAKDVWSKEAARRAAEKTLADAKDGKKNLALMFESDVKMPGPLQTPDGNLQLTPEDLEKLKQNIKITPKHTSIVTEGPDQLAGWNSDPNGAGGGSSGSGAGSGAPATTPAAPAPISATGDTLPAFGEMPALKYSHYTAEKREANLPGLQGAKDAAAILFDTLADGQLAPKVLDGDTGNYYVLQLNTHTVKDVKEFDKHAEDEIAKLQDRRAGSALLDWMRQRCDALNKAGKIKVAGEKVRETDENGKPLPQSYVPCYQLKAR